MSPRADVALSALLVVAFVAGWAWLDSAAAALLFGGMLAAAGAVFLRLSLVRNAALLAAATLLPFSGIEVVFTIIKPVPAGAGTRVTYDPIKLQVPDPLLGYRLPTGAITRAMARKGNRPVYEATYTIDGTGARATPGRRTDTDTYLFIGDSFVFGEGLNDEQTLPALFAAETGGQFNVVNLGVPGYGPGGVLRLLESGGADAHVVGRVRAVFVVVLESHLDRLSGDGSWLANTPRYVRDADGTPRYVGSFRDSRRAAPLSNALETVAYRLDSTRALLTALRRDEQIALLAAMLGRMRQIVRERYDAELVVIHWIGRFAERDVTPNAARVESVILASGVPTVSVADLIPGFDRYAFNIPNDGHPTERANRLVAKVLYHRFVEP